MLAARVCTELPKGVAVRPISQAVEDILHAICKAVEAKDGYTEGHIDRTARLASAIALRLGLPRAEIEKLKAGALLHDVGKIGIRDAILNKPGRLTQAEMSVMKTHPLIGERICKPLRPARALVRMIRNHHERLDGTGYPDGLKGDRISIGTRIVCVTDICDALSTDRPYRPALPKDEVRRILREEAGRGWWDPEVVEAAIETVGEGGPLANLPQASSCTDLSSLLAMASE